MRKFLTMLAVAGLTLAGALAAPTAASAEPSAKALALTRRMVTAMHVEETMAPMMRMLMQQQMDMIVAQRKGLTEQQRAMLSGVLTESVGEVMDAGLMSKVMEKFIPVYAEIYSETELQAVVEFYESPVGQSVLRKMPQMGPAATKVMIEIAPEIQADLDRRVSKKLEGLEALGK